MLAASMPAPGDNHGLEVLAIAVAALLLGPLIHRAARRERATIAALDSFVLIAVVGLVMLEILPRSLHLAGWPAFLALIAGLAGPAIAEGPLRLATRGTHRAALALATAGMALHSLTDGLALAAAHADGHGSHGLEVAVIAHQLPVAVAVWWLVAPMGLWVATLAMTALAAATVAGYALAGASLGAIDEPWLGLFEAVVGGLLLHVVAHRSHGTHEGRARVGAALGGLLGLGLLALLTGDGHGHEDPLARTTEALVGLFRASAPALLLAYGLAGLVAGALPDAPVRWLRRGGPAGQALRGVAIGLPMPLCSCGVVPVYRSLLRRGAPPAAALAFFVATPELGVDAILLSWPLLGGEMTIARVVAAGLVAWLVGWLVGRRAPAPTPGPAEAARGGPTGLWDGLRAGFGELVDATAPWIAAGLLIAALIEPWIDPSALTAVPRMLQVPLFAALGVPLYVCASGATPLVAALLLKGLSPGAALAFLLTGPATNATTFGVLTAEHGRATALRFAAAMFGLSVALGLALDVAVPGLTAGVELHGHEEAGALAEVAAWALFAVFLASFIRQGPHGFLGRLWEGGGHDHDHGHDHGHDGHDHHGHVPRDSHAHHGHEHHGHVHRDSHAHDHHGHVHRDSHAHHGHAHHEHAHAHDDEHEHDAPMGVRGSSHHEG